MQLQDYLNEVGETYSAFAERIGVANASVIAKYIAGKRYPRPRYLQAIVRETQGRVQPNDFLPAAAE